MGESHLVTPLVGRAQELEAMDVALGGVDRRRGLCLAIAGVLGLGKSRLLRELENRAEARGNLMLAAQGSELEAGIPYGSSPPQSRATSVPCPPRSSPAWQTG